MLCPSKSNYLRSQTPNFLRRSIAWGLTKLRFLKGLSAGTAEDRLLGGTWRGGGGEVPVPGMEKQTEPGNWLIVLFPGTCKSSHTTNPTSELTWGSRPHKNDFFRFSEPLESSHVIFFTSACFPSWNTIHCWGVQPSPNGTFFSKPHKADSTPWWFLDHIKAAHRLCSPGIMQIRTSFFQRLQR